LSSVGIGVGGGAGVGFGGAVTYAAAVNAAPGAGQVGYGVAIAVGTVGGAVVGGVGGAIVGEEVSATVDFTKRACCECILDAKGNKTDNYRATLTPQGVANTKDAGDLYWTQDASENR